MLKTVMDENSKKAFLLPANLDDRYRSLPQGQSGRNSFCGHVGPSMNPTLNEQDLLEITPYKNDRQPRVGDVILFLPPQLDYPVVHRIVSITSRGILTKGDNCRDTDPWYLKNGNIYGRVINAGCGNRQRKIAGGFIGRLAALSCLLRRRTNRLMENFSGLFTGHYV